MLLTLLEIRLEFSTVPYISIYTARKINCHNRQASPTLPAIGNSFFEYSPRHYPVLSIGKCLFCLQGPERPVLHLKDTFIFLPRMLLRLFKKAISSKGDKSCASFLPPVDTAEARGNDAKIKEYRTGITHSMICVPPNLTNAQ